MSKDNDLKKRSGIELRAQAAARSRPAAPPVSSRQQRLDAYREVIVRRQRDFVETGTALGLIAKESLFKEAGFVSFEAMVIGEFDMSTSTAYRLVDAARVVTILSQVGTVETKIRNQSQALALAPLGKDREAMVRVITAAEARGRITADLLIDVRVELYPHTKVIDGEVVPERPKLVEALRAEIESVADKQHQNTKDPVVSSTDDTADGGTSTSTTEEPPAAGTGAPVLNGEADRPVPAVTPPEDHRAATPGETDDAGTSSGTTDPATGQRSSSLLPLPAEQVEEQAPAGVTAPAPHHGDPAALLAWFAERFEQVDPDVSGPLLTADDMALIGESLGRVVFVVDRLTDWHERTRS